MDKRFITLNGVESETNRPIKLMVEIGDIVRAFTRHVNEDGLNSTLVIFAEGEIEPTGTVETVDEIHALIYQAQLS